MIDGIGYHLTYEEQIAHVMSMWPEWNMDEARSYLVTGSISNTEKMCKIRKKREKLTEELIRRI